MKKRPIQITVLLLSALAVVILHALFSGSAEFRDPQVLKILRLPRIVAAIAVGGGLAIAGATIQASLANPLADPFTLGIASAAALGNVLGVVFYDKINIPPAIFSLLFTLTTFIGVLVFLRNRFKNSLDIILTGIVLGLFFSSLATFILVLTDPSSWGTKLGILLGSFSSVTPNEALISLIVVFVCMIYLLMYSRALDLMAVNDVSAESAGLDLVRYRRGFFIAVSIITAICVSTAGVIGFIGFLIPHALRIIGIRTHRSLLLTSFLAGASLLLFSDTIARTFIASTELPVGVLISLLGAPAFLYLLKKEMN